MDIHIMLEACQFIGWETFEVVDSNAFDINFSKFYVKSDKLNSVVYSPNIPTN